MAFQAGKSIAEAGHMLITVATVGLPHFSSVGAKEKGGVSIGISPAASKIEHVKKYRLPTGCYDAILYTGLHYVGRDALLVASSDAVLSIGGRLGTLHEFTIAMEMHKPIGFLMGAGGISVEIKDIIRAAGSSQTETVLFDDDPKRLVSRLARLLDAINSHDLKIYREAIHCDVRNELLR